MARPGSPCLAKEARLARLPHPPAPAANGSSLPALSSPGRRGLGRIKQAEEKTWRPQRAGDSRAFRRPRGTLRYPSAAPQSGSKPRKCHFRDEVHDSFSQQGRLPRGKEARFPELPIPGHRCAVSPQPAPVRPQSAMMGRRGAGPRHCKSRSWRTAALCIG